MDLQPGAHIYFLGIGGTGMASAAGLCQEAGFKVSGSDANLYPPMSHMLEDLGIPVATPYDPANLNGIRPDMVVIANVLSRGHDELERVLGDNLRYTSFPALIGELFLAERISTVVTGTHGKTTTSSLLAHILSELGEDPGFFIGGIPRNFPRSFRLGKGPLFVVEGDEYDTAFFDKGPKFLHYRPKHLILNNLEFDHADIYDNLGAIEHQFENLVGLVDEPAHIIANMDDPGIRRLVERLGLANKVTGVATLGRCENADFSVGHVTAEPLEGGAQKWTGQFKTKAWGTLELETGLSGHHNMANLAQVIACLWTLEQRGILGSPINPVDLQKAIATFKNVARRLEHLGRFGGIDIFEDFAHHPTAVRHVIQGFRQAYPQRRLVVAFEPRSATQRRNVFQKDYGLTLALADRVFIGCCPLDTRIPEGKRMSTVELQKAIGDKAIAFAKNEQLLDRLTEELVSGDAVIFMSSGSFSGVQHELADRLRARFG